MKLKQLQSALRLDKFAVPAATAFYLLGMLLVSFAPLTAQGGPAISLSNTSVNAGDWIEITGTGFSPGGYEGSILIDGVLIETFDIPGSVVGGPPGGNFTVPFFIPTDVTAGRHLLEVCSLNPCATGEFEQRAGVQFTVLNVAAAIDATIGYVYDSDQRAAAAYKSLFETVGYTTEVIPLRDVLRTDFKLYDLIVIGNDTGDPVSRVWGSARDQDQHIASSQKPILAMGQSGALFFSNVQPTLSLDNADVQFRTDAYVADPSLAYYRQIYNLTPLIRQNPFVHLYLDEVETVLLKPIDDGTPQPIGYEGTPQDRITIAVDDCRQLWGYGGRPELLTRAGQALLINSVFNTMNRSCVDSPLPLCASVPSPDAMPEPGHIDFDRLGEVSIEEGVELTNLFSATHGVRFPAHKGSRLIATSETAAPRSKPNVALNLPLNPKVGSSGIPLLIQFAEEKSRVGFYFGTNDTVNVTAELTAYNVDQQPLCDLRRSPLPLGHTEFWGIEDAQARIASVSFDFGESPLAESIDDLYFFPQTPSRRIRICEAGVDRCAPAAGASLHVINEGASASELIADAEGFVDAQNIPIGTRVWALADVSNRWVDSMPISNTDRYSLYYTSDVVTIAETLFDETGVLIVPVSRRQPLMLYHAQISSEWVLDAGYRSVLESRVISGSNHLYDFTDGQFALGEVTVFQDLENWPFYDDAPEKADMRLYLNNNLRPEAEPGGAVSALISDTLQTDVAYRPGFMMMGSEWNRFHQPPGDPKIPELLEQYFPGEDQSILLQDWPLALAHELGHYLLFLFDTYLGFEKENDTATVIEIDSCDYSAMGWFYEVENRHFIQNPTDWMNCENTVAHEALERPEWNVIDDWYPWVVSPTAYVTGPVAPPVQLTTVTFVEPPPTSTKGLLAPTVYALSYNNVMTVGASVEARGYLIRDENRAIDQGAPAEDSTELELAGAKVGDRFCVIDINENVEDANKLRFHYGCEALESGDTQLFLEEDTSWAPVINPVPIGPTSWAVTVTGVTSTLPLAVTFYPESQTNAQSLVLTPAGETTSTGTIDLSAVTPAAYVELKVTSDDDLELNPARRAFVDFGIGGGSMWPGAHWSSHAPIYSPDGTVEFFRRASITLGPDQFVAVVRYLNTYPLPENAIGSSIPYGIVAWPPSLVNEGLINFHLGQSLAGNASVRGASADGGEAETVVVLHRWNGTEWEPLSDSRSILEPDGETLVSAGSRGAGIYVAVELPAGPNLMPALYLPFIH